MNLMWPRKKTRTEQERTRQGFAERVMPGDPVGFSRKWLGYEPYEYVWLPA